MNLKLRRQRGSIKTTVHAAERTARLKLIRVEINFNIAVPRPELLDALGGLLQWVKWEPLIYPLAFV
jgi:hypothetical protein